MFSPAKVMDDGGAGWIERRLGGGLTPYGIGFQEPTTDEEYFTLTDADTKLTDEEYYTYEAPKWKP